MNADAAELAGVDRRCIMRGADHQPRAVADRDVTPYCFCSASMRSPSSSVFAIGFSV